MSNQAHKNRTSKDKFNFPLKAFPKGFAFQETVNRKSFYKDRLKRQSEGMAARAEKDPQMNPSGRAKFKGSSYYSEPMGVVGIGSKEIKALPDPSASSRGANVRANKERGTQSSTQRKVIK